MTTPLFFQGIEGAEARLEEIDKQIADLKQERLVIKLVVKEYQREAKKKNKKPTIWPSKILAACTSPFAKLHEKAHKKIHDPIGYKAVMLIEKSCKLLDQAEKADPKEDNKKLLLKCIDIIPELEEQAEIVPQQVADVETLHILIKDLDKQIQRLRPELTEEQKQARDKFKEDVCSAML